MDYLTLGEKFLKHLKKPNKEKAAFLAASDLCCDASVTSSAVLPPVLLEGQDRIREVENVLHGIKYGGIHERDSLHIPRLIGIALQYLDANTQTPVEEADDGKASSEPIK